MISPRHGSYSYETSSITAPQPAERVTVTVLPAVVHPVAMWTPPFETDPVSVVLTPEESEMEYVPVPESVIPLSFVPAGRVNDALVTDPLEKNAYLYSP